MTFEYDRNVLSSVPKDLGIISEILWKSEVGQSMWFMILSVLHLAVLEDLLRRVWGHGTLELEGSVSELWFSCLQLEFHFIFFHVMRMFLLCCLTLQWYVFSCK